MCNDLTGKLSVHVGRVHYFAGSAIMYPENGLDVYQVYDRVRDLLHIAEDKALVVATNSLDVINLIAAESRVETTFTLHRRDGTILVLTQDELCKAIKTADVDFRRL